MNAPIKYTKDFVKDPDASFNALQKDLDWERREDAPRCEYYCNDFKVPYTYGRGKGVRVYEPREWHPVILDIRSEIEKITNCKFDVCFLNRYLDQSDHLGYHSDNSPEMDDERPIAIVSLGVEREIWFRENFGFDTHHDSENGGFKDPIIEKLKLEHGSLCLMEKHMQDNWMHRIPKASFKCGERISLTFRGYVQL